MFDSVHLSSAELQVAVFAFILASRFDEVSRALIPGMVACIAAASGFSAFVAWVAAPEVVSMVALGFSAAAILMAGNVALKFVQSRSGRAFDWRRFKRGDRRDRRCPFLASGEADKRRCPLLAESDREGGQCPFAGGGGSRFQRISPRSFSTFAAQRPDKGQAIRDSIASSNANLSHEEAVDRAASAIAKIFSALVSGSMLAGLEVFDGLSSFWSIRGVADGRAPDFPAQVFAKAQEKIAARVGSDVVPASAVLALSKLTSSKLSVVEESCHWSTIAYAVLYNDKMHSKFSLIASGVRRLFESVPHFLAFSGASSLFGAGAQPQAQPAAENRPAEKISNLNDLEKFIFNKLDEMNKSEAAAAAQPQTQAAGETKVEAAPGPQGGVKQVYGQGCPTGAAGSQSWNPPSVGCQGEAPSALTSADLISAVRAQCDSQKLGAALLSEMGSAVERIEHPESKNFMQNMLSMARAVMETKTKSNQQNVPSPVGQTNQAQTGMDSGSPGSPSSSGSAEPSQPPCE